MGDTKNAVEITRTRKTRVSKSEYEGAYVIKNFRDLNVEVGEYHESPEFRTGQFDVHRWTLDIFAGGVDSEYSKYVSVRFYLLNLDDENELAGLRFVTSLIDEDGNKYLTKSVAFPNDKCTNISNIKDFILREVLLNSPKLLPNGKMKIAFEIWYDGAVSADKEIQPSQKNQLNILGNVFDAGKYTDFKLIVNGKEFSVHRAFLAAHSPIFEAMFDSQMRERNEGKVEIVDVEEKVLEKLLRFIYVGQVENFDNLADKILIAAEKYQVEELKHACEDFLIDQLNLTNVYDTLRLADTYNAETLKKKSIEFFHCKAKQLLEDVNFKAHLNTLSENLKTDLIYFLVNKL